MIDFDPQSWTAIELSPATRVYEFNQGHRMCRPELRAWFEDHGIASRDVRLQHRFLPSSGTVWFRDPQQAMLFKLVWV